MFKCFVWFLCLFMLLDFSVNYKGCTFGASDNCFVGDVNTHRINNDMEFVTLQFFNYYVHTTKEHITHS